MKFSIILSASAIAVVALASQEAHAVKLKGAHGANYGVGHHDHHHHTANADESWSVRLAEWLRDRAAAVAGKDTPQKSHDLDDDKPHAKGSSVAGSGSGSVADISIEDVHPTQGKPHHLLSKRGNGSADKHSSEDFTLSSSSGSADSDDEEAGFVPSDYQYEAQQQDSDEVEAHAYKFDERESNEKLPDEHATSQLSSGSGDSADDDDIQYPTGTYPVKPTREPKPEGDAEGGAGADTDNNSEDIKPHLPKSPREPSDANEQGAENSETQTAAEAVVSPAAPIAAIAAVGAIAGIIGVVVAAVGLRRARRSDARYSTSELITDLPDPEADDNDEESPRAPEALVDAPASTTNALDEAEGSAAPLNMQSPFARDEEAGEFTNA